MDEWFVKKNVTRKGLNCDLFLKKIPFNLKQSFRLITLCRKQIKDFFEKLIK